MPRVEFEPTIPAFQRAKSVHALDRASIVIGEEVLMFLKLILVCIGHIQTVLDTGLMKLYRRAAGDPLTRSGWSRMKRHEVRTQPSVW
jgi:hypothetical protein